MLLFDLNFNRAQSVSLEFAGPKVIKVFVVHSARKETRATRVLTARREMLAKRANVDLKDYKEQPDWKVQKDPKVSKVLEVKPVLLDQLERRENSVFQVSPAIQDLQARKETKERLADLELPVTKEIELVNYNLFKGTLNMYILILIR